MRRVLIALAVVTALLPGLALAHGEDPPGAVIVDYGVEEQGDFSTIDEPIVVNGVVRGDVTSISGEIIIRGVVAGDVVSWGGDIRLEPQSRVDGHVMAVAGRVYQEGSDSIAGQVFNGNLDQAGFASLIPGVSDQQLPFGTRLGLALALFLIAMAIAGLLGHIWGPAVESAALVILHLPARTIGLGLLTVLLGSVALGLLLLLLSFMLVGLVLLPALLLIAMLPFLAGLASGGRALEQWLGIDSARGLGAALLLLPGLMLAISSPLLGILVFLIFAAPGLGALLLLRSAALRFHEA